MIDKYANPKALEKMRRADDLEEALHVSNPGIILTMIACVALIVGIFMWGFFGSVHTDISVTAVRLPGSSSGRSGYDKGKDLLCGNTLNALDQKS